MSDLTREYCREKSIARLCIVKPRSGAIRTPLPQSAFHCLAWRLHVLSREQLELAGRQWKHPRYPCYGRMLRSAYVNLVAQFFQAEEGLILAYVRGEPASRQLPVSVSVVDMKTLQLVEALHNGLNTTIPICQDEMAEGGDGL